MHRARGGRRLKARTVLDERRSGTALSASAAIRASLCGRRHPARVASRLHVERRHGFVEIIEGGASSRKTSSPRRWRSRSAPRYCAPPAGARVRAPFAITIGHASITRPCWIHSSRRGMILAQSPAGQPGTLATIAREPIAASRACSCSEERYRRAVLPSIGTCNIVKPLHSNQLPGRVQRNQLSQQR